jgi:hypothetical protein
MNIFYVEIIRRDCIGYGILGQVVPISWQLIGKHYRAINIKDPLASGEGSLRNFSS